MSRVGKKPIIIPPGVEVKIDGGKVSVKGPRGEISKEFRPEIGISLAGDKISLSLKSEESGKQKFVGSQAKKIKSFWGLTRMLIANMIEGVTAGFEKKLEIEGVGFKAEATEKELVLSVGFSHPVKLEIPEGVKVALDKKTIIVSGIDKESVGQFASNIRKTKPPEPYKGKGIRYAGEIIRRKVGKKVVTAGGK
jgi:large subunit ribosomal protein L6